MPELPEVEAARSAIAEHCLGKKIVKCIISEDSKVIDGVSSKEFEASLDGKIIVAAHRKGKNMWLELDSPPFPTFQFGMAGAVYIKGVAVTKYKRSAVKDNDEWPSKYSKFFVELNDGLELSFTDKRRFAKVRLLDNPVAVPPISELGPDAFLEPMSVDEFFKLLSKKNIGIKALLLAQGFISGIGNWIADEVLYQARIHPLQSASSMSKETCGTLLNCIHEVIKYAVQVDADCGRFPHEWLFHFRWGKKPGKVNGKKIEFIVAAGRTTAYVPEMQKLSGAQATKEEPQKDIVKRAKSSRKGNGSNDNDEADEKDLKVEAGKKTSKRKSASVKGKAKGGVKVSRNDEKEDSDNGHGDEDPKKIDEEDDEVELKRTTSKNVSRRRKPLESGDSTGGYDDENKNNRYQKKAKGGVKVSRNDEKEDSDNGRGDEDPKKIDEEDNEGEFKRTTSKNVSRRRNDEDKNNRYKKKAKQTEEKNVPKKNVESSQSKRSTRKKAQ